MVQNYSDEKNTRNISDETVLKVSKEIAVKFIEMGRITPATFPENFIKIFDTIQSTTSKRD